MKNKSLFVVLLAPAVFGLAQAESPAEIGATQDDSLVTDFRGKPPFKRTLQSADEADATIARLEEVEAPEVGDRVVEFRGKPPHRRSVVTESDVESATFARLEELAEEPAGKTLRKRAGPPGKTGRTLR